MATIESIRKMNLREGKSIGEISKTSGMSRQSVRKAFTRDVKRSYVMAKLRACPSIDPIVVLKTALLGYLYGIASE